MQSLRHEIQQHWGDVQILVNNAGIASAVSFADMSDETWDANFGDQSDRRLQLL